MAEQPDFWPMMAPKSDPDIELRDRWRRALMILGALDIDGLPLRAVTKWVENPNAPEPVLVALLYGWDGAKARAAEALEFLAEKGLIDAPS